MQTYLIIAVVTFFAALVQATMGFGGALVLINMLPMFYPYSKSVAYVQGCIVLINFYYMIRYRDKIRWDVLTAALIPGVLLSLVFTFVSVTVNSATMEVLLGVLLIGLAIYYLLVVDKIKMKPSKTNGVILGSFSGVTNAMFGMAGPPVALYLTPSIDDNFEYFITCQTFFSCSSATCIAVRLYSGIYEVSDIPVLAMMIAIFFIGTVFGLKVIKKVDSKILKKIIYVFIGLNGVYMFVMRLVG